MIVSRRTGMYRYIPAQCVCHVDSHDAGPLSRTGKRMHHTRRYLQSRPVYALSPRTREAGNREISRLGTGHSQETKVPRNCSSQFKGPAVYQSSAKGGRQCRFHTGSGAPAWRLAKFCLLRASIQGTSFFPNFLNRLRTTCVVGS